MENNLRNFTLVEAFMLVDLIFYKDAPEKPQEAFIIFLKNLDIETRKYLFGLYPPHFVNWFEKEISSPDHKMSNEESQELLAPIFQQVPKRVKKYNEDKTKYDAKIKEFHLFMKGNQDYGIEHISDQNLGVKRPDHEKEVKENAGIIDLPQATDEVVKKKSIFSCFTERASRRKYTDESLTLEELSFLLYSTQGVRKKADDDRYHLRMAPSGGARQPYETYLGVNHVDGLKSGIYRYLPAEHKLELIREADDLKDKMAEYAFGQSFVGKCAVCFFWAVVPYRTEWRYGLEAKKDLLIEAGHICQNLYLAVEAIEAGTCSICAYDQEKVDKLLEIDGETEFVTYLSPVGKLEK